MTRANVASLCAISGLFLANCGGGTGGAIEVFEGEDVGMQSDPLFLEKGIRYFTENGWQAPICFTGGSTEARNDVKNALWDSWQNVSRLRFTGFGTCPANPPSTTIPILMEEDGKSCILSEAVSGLGARMVNGHQVRISVCPERVHLKYVAIHEVGHAIGLFHEHQRPDRPESEVQACLAQFQAAFPGQPLQFGKATPQYNATKYDRRSMMNYCRDWDGNGVPDQVDKGEEISTLSPQDAFGIEQIYGSYDSGIDRPRAAFSSAHTANVGTQTVASQRAFNTHGLVAHTIARESVGTYRVDFPRQALAAGNFQVDAVGSSARCKIRDWTFNGSTMQLRVLCWNNAGSLVDSRFSAKWLMRSDEEGWEGAYVYANQPAANSYVATGLYNWNSQDADNVVTRVGTGVYVVNLQGQEGVTGDRGVAEVTAVGTGSEYCNISSHGPDDNGGEDVTVRCFTRTGSLVNTPFMLNFGHQSTFGTRSYAHVQSRTLTGTFTPSRQKSYNNYDCSTPPGPSTVTRTNVGRYEVTFKGMWTSSSEADLMGRVSAKVNAYDTAGAGTYCNPSTLTFGLDPMLVVNCFTASGSPVDSWFEASLGTTYSGSCN